MAYGIIETEIGFNPANDGSQYVLHTSVCGLCTMYICIYIYNIICIYIYILIYIIYNVILNLSSLDIVCHGSSEHLLMA